MAAFDISHQQSAGTGDVFTGPAEFGDQHFGGSMPTRTWLWMAGALVAGVIIAKLVVK